MKIDDKVLDYVSQGFHIPPKPEILEEIQQLAQTPDVDPGEVGRCIAKDVGLSADVLKTMNSPFYGMARMITDVTQATILLGVNSVLSLVAAEKIKQALTGNCCISLERFWDSASDIAHAMTFIAKQTNLGLPPENLHIIGLFHDCGLPAMAMKYPDYVDVLGEANHDHDKSIIDYEEEHYRTNHAVVGYFLSNSWGLPKEICQVIARHHDVEALHQTVSPEFRSLYSCLKLACNVMENIRRFKDTRDWPLVEDAVLGSLGLSNLDYDELEEDLSELFIG